MLDVSTITDDRQMRALTGLDLAAFCALTEPFMAGCQAEANVCFSVGQPRQRRPGGGRKGTLASSEQKLLFHPVLPENLPHFGVVFPNGRIYMLSPS